MRTTGFLKALGDETRLRTFRVLAEAHVGLCVAELSDILQKPQYAISRSLIELRKVGLLGEARQGKFVYYSLTAEASVIDLGAWLVQHCQCDPADRNTDGSSAPGGSLCHYDDERLKWRLALREDAKAPVTRPGRPEPHRPRVLFVCIHNSARSQLAEEYLRDAAGDQLLVESAGLTPGTLNPHVVAILAEEGLDISHKKTQSVSELYRRGETYEWVITVCSRDAEENCPVFPGPVRRLSWPFPDPSRFTGTNEEVRAQVRALAADIKTKVKAFIEERQGREQP